MMRESCLFFRRKTIEGNGAADSTNYRRDHGLLLSGVGETKTLSSKLEEVSDSSYMTDVASLTGALQPFLGGG
jgi:hypothetical protein